MRVNQRTFAPALVEPETTLAPLDLISVFGREARIEVDLGCGDGSFLVALAQEDLATNFIGIERLPGRVRSACRKIGDYGLTNAKILQEDILNAVQQFLAPGSIDIFYLMFPDPWPKRRHFPRRTVKESFLRAISRALKPGGELRIATDHADYFAVMEDILQEFDGLEPSRFDHSLGKPISSFEKYYRNNGVAIHRLALRKVSERRNGMASQRSG